MGFQAAAKWDAWSQVRGVAAFGHQQLKPVAMTMPRWMVTKAEAQWGGPFPSAQGSVL